MIRNYNGQVDRTLIRGLKKVCNVSAENEKNLFEALKKDGKVSFYENLDFFGLPDEMSKKVTLRTEKSIKKYLKEDVEKRVDTYLKAHKHEEDYLLSALVEYIKENSKFPERDVMKQIEKAAEAKRIAELPTSNECIKKEITKQDIALEILELAEEIMEYNKENNPDAIFTPVEPYHARMSIDSDEFSGMITQEIYYGTGDVRDYGCELRINDNRGIGVIHISYRHDYLPIIRLGKGLRENIDIKLTESLIIIHKGFVEMAKKIDFEFESEIDYQKFSSKKE